jgi:alpha-aminoadipic semialdehyde synthase
MHTSLEDAKDTIRRAVGKVLKEQGTRQPEPLVLAITGKGGNVYCGVMEILDLIPHQVISVEDLPQVHELDDDEQDNHFQVYVVPLTPSDLYRRLDEDQDHPAPSFDRAAFEQAPFQYISTFHERIAPYVHVLVNCMYWDDRYPRLLTKDHMSQLYESGKRR